MYYLSCLFSYMYLNIYTHNQDKQAWTKGQPRAELDNFYFSFAIIICHNFNFVTLFFGKYIARTYLLYWVDGSLTQGKITMLQTYNEKSIRNNAGDPTAMRNAVWATQFYCMSTDKAAPSHPVCVICH